MSANSEGKIWSMRNGDGSVELSGLSHQQVYGLYEAFSTDILNEWIICEEGSQTWQALDEVDWEDFIEKSQVTGNHIVPRRSLRPKSPKLKTNLQFEEVDGARRRDNAREFRRFHKSLIFKMTHRGKILEYMTADISMGGILLSTPLPPDVAKVIRARLIRNGEAIQITCSVVNNSAIEGAQLRIETVSDRQLLNQWLIQF